MKYVSLSRTILAILVVFLVYQPFNGNPVARASDECGLPERDDFRQSYQLPAGASVSVSGINGSVTIETTDSNTAEVHIIRCSDNKESLEYRKVIIEQTTTGLVIRGQNDQDHHDVKVKQQVFLKLPHQVNLSVNGVNGSVTTGNLEGPVKISGINGKVNVGAASDRADISGVNGSVSFSISHLREGGINVKGINGKVEIMFSSEVNADLDMHGINGKISTELNNLSVQGKISRDSLSGKIGSGGPRINISGVNGSVRLVRAGVAG